jgi:hypothetical protein
MAFFWNFISVLGGTVALVGAAAFLSKLLAQHWLTKNLEEYKFELLQDIETHKAQLARANAAALDHAKFDFEKELISRRGEVDLFRDEMKYLNESEQQRHTRLQTQIRRWANPILGAIGDLEHRLSNILEQQGFVALFREQEKAPQWSADYSYFMASTLYYFAQYFCWVRLMQHQFGYELFQSSREMEEFFSAIERVADELSRYPYEEHHKMDATPMLSDKQVFRLQQRAIGELLVDKTTVGEQIVTYREFLDRWLDPNDVKLRRHIAPLESFLIDLRPDSDLRWTRLIGMRAELDAFREACNSVLNLE